MACILQGQDTICLLERMLQERSGKVLSVFVSLRRLTAAVSS